MVEFDLLVIGGGLVGSSLAAALRGSGLKVCVVEALAATASGRSGAHPSYDERVIALSLSSQRIFGAMGVWDAMAADSQAITRVHVSDRGHFGFSHLSAEDEGVDALGYVTPARSIGAALSEGLRDDGDLELLCPARLVGLHPRADRVDAEVVVDGRSRLVSARLLVAADGGDSSVRRRLGFAVRERDYDYDAVISTVTPQLPPGFRSGIAFERFTDSGPLAMLPMTQGRYSVVWTARRAETSALLALDDETFLARLQQRFGGRLGSLTKPGRRIAYPLRLVLAKQLTRPRLALIGNAAHTLHPVAGQGFNLGLRDVAVLAELLTDACSAGADTGGAAVLKEYRRLRAPDQANVAMFTDTLARLFANPWGPVRLVRNLGLLGLDLLPPARHSLARRFMGLDVGPNLPWAGPLPQSRLARGVPLASAGGSPRSAKSEQ